MKKYIYERSESITGEQKYITRKKRGRNRKPSWDQINKWRSRWSKELVLEVFDALWHNKDLSKIQDLNFVEENIDGIIKQIPDLRGFDITLIKDEGIETYFRNKDFSYYHFEGAILTNLLFNKVNLYRAHFEKATLRNVSIHYSKLIKAHVEDADLRGCSFNDTDIGFLRYTEDSWLVPGTIFRNTNLKNTQNLDPILERYAKDQEFLYIYKYRKKVNRVIYFLWWLTSNYGRSLFLWATWCLLLSLIFGFFYLIVDHGNSLNIEVNTPDHWFTFFYYSIVTFTTLGFGDVTPKSILAEIIVTIEVIFGYIMLGGLISILANKMARRS